MIDSGLVVERIKLHRAASVTDYDEHNRIGLTMLSLRPAIRALTSRGVSVSSSVRSLSSLTTIEEGRQAIENEKSLVQRKIEAMSKMDKHMVFGSTVEEAPPVLPENPAEITSLDPAHLRDAIMPDGQSRVVHVRQSPYKVGQNPMTAEKKWVISFMDEGEAAQTWDNALMGWVSGADPMASNIQTQMSFKSAADAVYFAKKRGWQFVVDEPIYRTGRSDDAQYQDCFLPQSVVAKVKRDRTNCNHWERPLAGTSHYDRPLKYHGDGEVVQHGPNGTDAPAKHVAGHYKMR